MHRPFFMPFNEKEFKGISNNEHGIQNNEVIEYRIMNTEYRITK
jgi:hypothetical protein